MNCRHGYRTILSLPVRPLACRGENPCARLFIELEELTEARDDDGRYGPGTGSPPVTVWAKAPRQTGVKARKARREAVFFTECLDTVYLLKRLLR